MLTLQYFFVWNFNKIIFRKNVDNQIWEDLVVSGRMSKLISFRVSQDSGNSMRKQIRDKGCCSRFLIA